QEDAHARPYSGGKTEREQQTVPVESVELQLRPDDRELSKGRIDDRPLEMSVAVKDETEHSRQDEQKRKDREEAVVGDRGRQVAALVVGVLLQHSERKA